MQTPLSINTTVDTSTIVLVDDHPLLREGLAMLICRQPDLKVIGQAATPDEAVSVIAERAPDLAVVDLALKDGHGLVLTKRIRAEFPATRVLVHSMYEDELYAERAMRAGASGYVNKQEDPEKLIEAIRNVLAGKVAFNACILGRMGGRAGSSSQRAGAGLIESLTDRELQVFELVGAGLTTRRIASRLKLSTHTIDTHREKIKAKLRLTSGVELMRHAVRWLLERQ